MNARRNRIENVEAVVCPRRAECFVRHAEETDHWQRGRWATTQAEADAEVAEFMEGNPNGHIGNVLWCFPGDPPRTCSFCGGVHPDDAIALIKSGWEVDPTDKWYKRYLEPPGSALKHKRAMDWLKEMREAREKGLPEPARPESRVLSLVPPVKLYVQHFSAEQVKAFNQALPEHQRPKDN